MVDFWIALAGKSGSKYIKWIRCASCGKSCNRGMEGVGEVEGVAGDAAALVEAVGLVVEGELGEGLDEGGRWL